MKTINILGFITDYSWYSETATTPRGVAKILEEAGETESIHVKINSGGGDAFAGISIYNLLEAHKGTVTVEVIGLAASAASIIAMAGTLKMQKGSMMMIHEPRAFTFGDAARHEAAASSLRKLIDSAVDIYISGCTKELKAGDVKKEMNKETWYTAKECVTKGWAIEVTGNDKKAAESRIEQALTASRNMLYDEGKIPGHINLPTSVADALAVASSPDDGEETHTMDERDKKIAQLEAKIEQLEGQNTKLEASVTAKTEAIDVLTSENKKLKTKVDAAEKSELDAKVKAELSLAKKEGRLAKKDEEKWQKRLESDFPTFSEILREQPKVVQAEAEGENVDEDDADTEYSAETRGVVADSLRAAGYSEEAIKAALSSGNDPTLGEGA